MAFPGRPLSVAASYVGRQAAEPTIGVNKNGTVFFAAAFDAVVGRLARAKVLRFRRALRFWDVADVVRAAEALEQAPGYIGQLGLLEGTEGRR